MSNRMFRRNFGKSTGMILLIPVLVLMGAALSACGTSGDLGVGDPAPSFTLPTSSGEQVSLADYKGVQPVLLYFHMADG